MITDNFASNLALVPVSAGGVAKWDDTVGSAASCSFIAGSTQPVELAPTASGITFLANVVNPTKIHQAAELKILFGASIGSTAFSGVFCRYTDASNFVMVRINHNSRICELVEVIAASETVLATAPLTASGDIIGASARIEVIGKRARIWYEPHFRPMPDEPPDIAADLAGTYTSVGEWGIYINSNTADSDMRVCSFTARELPSKCLPPPFLIAEAATGYNLAPITATVTNINASAGSLEWEIYPADSGDFAEAYKDIASATITVRTFWVRAGYAYDVRVRELKKNGGNNPWTGFSRVTAAGSRVAPDSPTMPDIDFPSSIGADGVDLFAPDYVLDREQIADVQAVVSDSGRSNLTAPFTRPPNSFKLLWRSKGMDTIQPLIDFFEETQGRRTSFKWAHPISGQQFAMNFTADDYEYTPTDSRPEGVAGVLGDLSLDIAEVVVDGIGTLSVTLTVAPELLGA